MKMYLFPEILYGLGFIIFIISLALFSNTLCKLLRVIKPKSKLWILPLISCFLLFIGLAFHYISIGYAHTQLQGIPDRCSYMIYSLHKAAEAIFMLLASLLSIISVGLYYRWTTK